MNIVIVGAGFGGLEVAKQLCKSDEHEITIVDQHNYHLFQPLLYQLASAALLPSDISSPVRNEFRKCRKIRCLLEQLVGIDVQAKEVKLTGSELQYDRLILACGSRTNYFGNTDWEKYTHPIKTLKDAREIRNRVLLNHELANQTIGAEKSALQNFVIIGGGPTGVELAGSLYELGQVSDRDEYKWLQKKDSNVVLIEKGNQLLPSFPKPLSDYALKTLKEIGVEVRLNSEVTNISDGQLTLESKEVIKSRCIIWAAGVCPSEINDILPFEKSENGRIKVKPNLEVVGQSGIYCIGDQAYCLDQNNHQLPGLASVAKQQGKYLGKALRGAKQGYFTYRNWGQMATIGTKKAVVDFGFFSLRGFSAWVVWSLVHILMLVGFRNKFMVFSQWVLGYLTFQPGAQIFDEEIFVRRKPKENIS